MNTGNTKMMESQDRTVRETLLYHIAWRKTVHSKKCRMWESLITRSSRESSCQMLHHIQRCLHCRLHKSWDCHAPTHMNVIFFSQARRVEERAVCLLLLPEVTPQEQSSIQLLSKWSVTSVTSSEVWKGQMHPAKCVSIQKLVLEN